jgi:hypothetical protein
MSCGNNSGAKYGGEILWLASAIDVGFGDINFEPRHILTGLFRLYSSRAQEYSLLLLGKRGCYPFRRLKQK